MKLLKKYLITLLIGFAIVALILWAKDIFSQTSTVKIFHILTDAFFATGVFITSAGLLFFSSNEGTFDMLVYGVNSFFDIFRKTSKKKYETFYDYRESRKDTKIKFGFMVVCGVFFLAVSMIMYLFYKKYS